MVHESQLGVLPGSQTNGCIHILLSSIHSYYAMMLVSRMFSTVIQIRFHSVHSFGWESEPSRLGALQRIFFQKSRGQDYKEKHKTWLKTNVKRTVLNNTKLRHFWAQIVSWAPIHARKTFIILAPGLTRNFFVFGKSSQNSPNPVLICWSSIPCVFCLYTLLKIVGYYDLSVLPMSQWSMGFQKKSLDVGGWGERYPIFLGIFGILLTL